MQRIKIREVKGKIRFRISDFGFRIRNKAIARVTGRTGPMEPDMKITLRTSVIAPVCSPMDKSEVP